MIAPTAAQIDLLHHTLGLTPQRRESFRNHFMAGGGHYAQQDLLALEAAGLMAQGRTPSFCDDGDMLFMCTDSGKAFALDSLPSPSLPLKKTRYQQFLDADCGRSFAEYLGIELPKRQHSYDYRTPNHFRLKSSRATGDYALTLKEAKASYKAALKATHVRGDQPLIEWGRT